ncbi:hypothetical protein GCM10023221_20250 [Luteimicrobium xylanilyticum]
MPTTIRLGPRLLRGGPCEPPVNADGDAGFAECDAGFAECDAGFAECDAGFAECDAGFAECDGGVRGWVRGGGSGCRAPAREAVRTP